MIHYYYLILRHHSSYASFPNNVFYSSLQFRVMVCIELSCLIPMFRLENFLSLTFMRLTSMKIIGRLFCKSSIISCIFDVSSGYVSLAGISQNERFSSQYFFMNYSIFCEIICIWTKRFPSVLQAIMKP